MSAAPFIGNQYEGIKTDTRPQWLELYRCIHCSGRPQHPPHRVNTNESVIQTSEERNCKRCARTRPLVVAWGISVQRWQQTDVRGRLQPSEWSKRVWGGMLICPCVCPRISLSSSGAIPLCVQRKRLTSKTFSNDPPSSQRVFPYHAIIYHLPSHWSWWRHSFNYCVGRKEKVRITVNNREQEVTNYNHPQPHRLLLYMATWRRKYRMERTSHIIEQIDWDRQGGSCIKRSALCRRRLKRRGRREL